MYVRLRQASPMYTRKSRTVSCRAIDGETTPVTLEALAGVLPGIFRLQQNDTILIVLDYEEWKTRLLRAQKLDQENRR